jgi:hypothetical protein
LKTITYALVVDGPPKKTQRKIKSWAKNNGYKILVYRNGYMELKLSRGYSRAMVVFYILTFWIGAIVHRLLRIDEDKLQIYIHPYGPGTYLHLQGQGKEISPAIKDIKKEIKAKTFKKQS